MSATMETLEVAEQHPARHRDSAVRQNRQQKGSAPAIVRKGPVERWSSNLAPQDLQCLLSMLEGHVLPKLIANYSPSAVAPIEQLQRPAS